MPIRRHLDGEPVDSPEDLALVTESAVVANVEALDHNRNDEVRAAAGEYLARCGHEECIGRRPDGDVDVDWERALAAVDDGAITGTAAEALRALKGRIDRPYPALVRIDLSLDEPLDFLPGQYVAVSYEGTPRAYSLAGQPGSDRLTLCVRRVPGGELTSELFTTLSVGDEVTVRGPYGEMVLEEPISRDLAFLATGTGVAPFKSMVDHVVETGADLVGGDERDVWIFLGCAWEDDLAFREHFRALDAERQNVHFVPTLSREPYVTDWAGETDYVQYTLAKYLDEDAVSTADLPAELLPFVATDPVTDDAARIDPRELDVYACGVSAMVSSLVEYARAMGVPEERIEAEGFG